MSLVVLPRTAELSEGDDLWAFADQKNSKILKEIDWFTHFQLQNKKLNLNKPILVCANKKLPTKAILSLPFNGNPEKWCLELSSCWKKLGRPKLRVFAPDSIHNVKTLHELNNNPEKIHLVINI